MLRSPVIWVTCAPSSCPLTPPAVWPILPPTRVQNDLARRGGCPLSSPEGLCPQKGFPDYHQPITWRIWHCHLSGVFWLTHIRSEFLTLPIGKAFFCRPARQDRNSQQGGGWVSFMGIMPATDACREKRMLARHPQPSLMRAIHMKNDV